MKPDDLKRNYRANRDDIVLMARKAGGIECDCCLPYLQDYSEKELADFLERFAELVAAAEREKVARWMMERGYATGHGDTIEELLNELEWQVVEREREIHTKLPVRQQSSRQEVQ